MILTIKRLLRHFFHFNALLTLALLCVMVSPILASGGYRPYKPHVHTVKAPHPKTRAGKS
jgi:hypothetical protein